MVILNGQKIASKILENVKLEVAKLSFQPVFCDVLVGTDPASTQYVKMKAKTSEKVGIKFRTAEYPPDITTEDLILEIQKIGKEQHMCGIIVQLPLPAHLDRHAVLDSIDPKLDVDCIGKVNSELFYQGKAYLEFPTALAVMAVLESTKIEFKNKHFLIIGHGQLVGKPVEFLFKKMRLNVQVVKNKDQDISNLLKQSNVIVSAVGKSGLITGDNLSSGVVIIDAGTSESEGGIVGDVNFESVKNLAGYLSPVPGGVGPVTVAKLLENVLKVAKK
jgi:methylenetetrahydrofolate dehydrogenase (NADP+)/methenyltetrahydrofolate cyclohydrolase